MTAATMRLERLAPLRERCVRWSDENPGPAAANAYALASTKVWGRVRTLETLLGEHANIAILRNELNAGAAHPYAGDLEHVAKLLGDAIAFLGGEK